MKAPTLCIGKGGLCNEIIAKGPRCDACEREWKDARNLRIGPKRDTHVERDVPGWRRIRAGYLRRHPRCARCGAAATHVHHVLDRALGGDSSDRNLESLCASCHNRHTALTQPRAARR